MQEDNMGFGNPTKLVFTILILNLYTLASVFLLILYLV